MSKSNRKPPEHTYVGPEYLTNVKTGQTEPLFSRDWEFYLFCHRDRPNGEPFIHTIKGPTESACAAVLCEFIDRPDVTLLEADSPDADPTREAASA